MKTRAPMISARKRPRQERSTRLVEDILEAALRVLVREGARRFTTVRVAEEAGVSVGSLYQYFPNKEALLFRLQADEWAETFGVLEEVFGDRRMKPLDRLRRAVLLFFRSERDEAALRVALRDAQSLIRNAPELRALEARVKSTGLAFMAEALPNATAKEQAFAAEVVFGSMSAVAEKITERERSRAEVDAWARASAEMYCSYLERLARAR